MKPKFKTSTMVFYIEDGSSNGADTCEVVQGIIIGVKFIRSTSSVGASIQYIIYSNKARDSKAMECAVFTDEDSAITAAYSRVVASSNNLISLQ